MAVPSIFRKNQSFLAFLSRYQSLTNFKHHRATYSQQAPHKKGKDELDIDEPVPFSSSKAAQYDAVGSQMQGIRTNRPNFEPWVVKISLASFLIYFLVLREESDWDERVDLSGHGTLPELELVMLKNKKRAALSQGSSFPAEEQARLEELEIICKDI